MDQISNLLSGLPERECPTCGGRGKVSDPREIGARMRRERVLKEVSVHEVARRMNFSAAYISDLELGRRAWNHKLLMHYLKAVKYK